MIYLVKMLRLCSDFSDNVQNVQILFRMFRQYSDSELFGQCSECSDTVQNVQTIFRLCSVNVQNGQYFQSMFRMFRICPEFSVNVQNLLSL
jgi:hypothetical protein